MILDYFSTDDFCQHWNCCHENEIFSKTKLNQLEDLVDLLRHKVGFNFALQTKNQDMYILLIIKSYIVLADRQVTSSREGLISVCGIFFF